MLSPRLRRDVFELWTLFWSSGMSNPLVAIEQITYLLFLKQLEELDHERQGRQLRSIYAPRPNEPSVAEKNLDTPAALGTEGDKISSNIEKCLLPHSPDDIANDEGSCRGHESCRWSYIRKNPSNEHISQYVFPWLREISKILHETGNSTDAYEAIGNQMMMPTSNSPKKKVKHSKKRSDELMSCFQPERFVAT
ncbi:MAG: hypothetical protein HC780_29620 [Leptolyngbyaceae cyanobacterium CSU_1_3]|nr:hypothetical protein [Leptolyngbyaceae cyanobacterium CSU_1_3]